MEIIENYSLKKLNTFGIDVNAKRLSIVKSKEDIVELANLIDPKNDKIQILGSGSNILFKDDFDGTIIKSEILGIKELKKDANNIYIEVGGGVIWDDLVNYCVNKNYGGIENLTLIPGTVGAAPIQNIGAYGVEFEDVFEELEGFNLSKKEFKIYKKHECEFGYRDSLFKREFKNKFLITSVTIKLNLKPQLKISYRAIKDYVQKRKIDKIDIKILSEIVRKIRQSKLPDPDKLGNAGSFFKNPIIDEELFFDLKDEYPGLVFFEIEDYLYKIPAGWLIEKSGFKGMQFGRVGVHKDQALVLVNYGNATGEEVVKLAEKIKAEILKKFNIVLETEVNIV